MSIAREMRVSAELFRCKSWEKCAKTAQFCCLRGNLKQARYAHSPWRISGSATPVAVMPSMSSLPEPIIQSTWIRLSFAPLAASCFRRQLVAVAQAGGVGLTQRDMRRGILIEQRVEEEQAAGGDRRRVRHKCDFAQTPRAVIGVDQPLQDILPSTGARFDDATFFKSHLDAFNHGALMRQRLGRRYSAIRAIFMRSGEDFFRGHIGDAVEAVAGSGSAAEPKMIIGQAEAEIGAGSAILQRGIALLVQIARRVFAGRHRGSSTRPPDRRR